MPLPQGGRPASAQLIGCYALLSGTLLLLLALCLRRRMKRLQPWFPYQNLASRKD